MIKIFKSITSVIVKTCEAIESFVNGCHNFVKLFEEVSDDVLKEHQIEAKDARAKLEARLASQPNESTKD